TGYLAETHEDYDEPKLAAIAEAQSAGRVRSGNPFDIMAIVIAMSTAWPPVSHVYAATGDEPETVHESRRALLRDCGRRATAPECRGLATGRAPPKRSPDTFAQHTSAIAARRFALASLVRCTERPPRGIPDLAGEHPQANALRAAPW